MKQLDHGAAQPFNVEGIAADEIAQPLHRLGIADQPAGAAPVDIHLAGLLIHFAHGMTAADRTLVGKLVGLGISGPLFRDDAHDLRDHVAGALDHHRIADANVLARDLVLIVQGGVLHHHAAHRHRLQPRHRRQLAGAADLDLDAFQHGFGLFGGEFMRNGPARAA